MKTIFDSGWRQVVGTLAGLVILTGLMAMLFPEGRVQGAVGVAPPSSSGGGNNYDPRNFATNAGKIYDRPNKRLTNLNAWAGITFPGSPYSNTLFNTGSRFVFSNAFAAAEFGSYDFGTAVWTLDPIVTASISGGAISGTSVALSGGGGSYVAIPGTNGNAININGLRQDLSYTGSGAAGTNVSVTASNGHAFYLLLTNNAHFTATALTFGQNLTVAVVQGGIGGYAVSFNTNVLRTNQVDGYTILTNVGGVSFITLVPGPYHTNAAVGVRKGY